MNNPTLAPNPLATHPLVLDSQHAVHVRPMGDNFYQALDSDFAGFRGCALIAEHRFEVDWPTWEMHPAGDEILYLVSGKIEMRVLIGDDERRVLLDNAGQSAVMPKGCWHTGRVIEAATVLFITPGEGTQNVEKPPQHVTR